jgi:putative hydrolase of the HAD superfamily
MEEILTMINSSFNLNRYKWFYFDLDGTLHDFVYASTKANECAVRILSDTYKINYTDALSAYNRLFKNSQKTHFVNNLSSNENRLLRFDGLIHEYSDSGISPFFRFEMLHEYNMNFSKNIAPFKNILKLFVLLKQRGKKIAIISEGPQDAQEFVLQQLGLVPLNDILITSSYYNISKSDGLFKLALKLTQANNEEVLMLGDSIERDILPAKELNIDHVLVDHHEKYKDYSDGFFINNFDELIQFI